MQRHNRAEPFGRGVGEQPEEQDPGVADQHRDLQAAVRRLGMEAFGGIGLCKVQVQGQRRNPVLPGDTLRSRTVLLLAVADQHHAVAPGRKLRRKGVADSR